MIQNCQQFEQRIQQLLDRRIDPETDEAICSHTTICSNCYESLMTYSLLHTNYLNDSDSMKIKLENLGLHEVLAKEREEPNRRYLFAIAASIAAMVLLFATLAGENLLNHDPTPSIAKKFHSDPAVPIKFRVQTVDLESLVRIKEQLDQYDLYSYSTDLPVMQPFKALSVCFDWFQKSWFGRSDSDNSNPDVGQILDLDQQYSSHFKLASCS